LIDDRVIDCYLIDCYLVSLVVDLVFEQLEATALLVLVLLVTT
jgi:hypothetical protein